MTQISEFQTYTHRITILVEAKTQILHPQDIQELRLGEYSYHITALTDNEAKEVALNMFHHSVPIKEVENYHIKISKIDNLLPEDPNDFKSEFNKTQVSIAYVIDLLIDVRIRQGKISKIVPDIEMVKYTEFNTIIGLACDVLANFKHQNEFSTDKDTLIDLQDLIFSNLD